MLRMTSLVFGLLLAAASGLTAAGTQADPSALFERGVTWDAFLEGVEARAELWRTNAARAAPDAAMVERLRAAGENLRILAVAVDACSDSVSTVPYIAKLAELAGVELRIVDSTVGRAIMEQHRTPDDRAATPTIVLLRGSEMIGVFVERPKPLQDWYLSDAGQAMRQADRVSRKMSWYDWDRGDSTVAEIVALAEHSPDRP